MDSTRVTHEESTREADSTARVNPAPDAYEDWTAGNADLTWPQYQKLRAEADRRGVTVAGLRAHIGEDMVVKLLPLLGSDKQ